MRNRCITLCVESFHACCSCSEADAAKESTVTHLTIRRLSFASLALISNSNSDARANSFPHWRKQNLNSSQVHLLCLLIKLPFLFTQRKRIKFLLSLLRMENGWSLIFNSRGSCFPNTAESLPHIYLQLLVLNFCVQAILVLRVLSMKSGSEKGDRAAPLHKISDPAPDWQNFHWEKILCPIMFAHRDNKDRAYSFSAEFIWWHFRDCYE